MIRERLNERRPDTTSFVLLLTRIEVLESIDDNSEVFNVPGCIMQHAEKKLIANCSYTAIFPVEVNNETKRIFNVIPSDMDENIEILDISDYSFNISLSSTHLQRYSHITEFYAKHTVLMFTDSDVFAPVANLKLLDLTGTRIESNTPKLPLSITTIRAYGLRTTGLDVSKLDYMENLFFGNNGLKDFPLISEIAPLTNLDLSNNREMNVTLMNIAPFCLLKEVNLSATRLEEADSSTVCCDIFLWLIDINTTLTLSCKGNGQHCETISDGEAQAEAKFSECVHRYFSNITETAIQLVIIGALISSICYLIYKYYKSSAVRQHRGSSFFLPEPQ